MVGVLVTTQSTHLAVQQPAGRRATTPAPNATPTSTVSKPVSQSPGDARVYGIDQAVAALPIGGRVWPPDSPPVPGGLSAPKALAGRPGSWRLAGSLTSAFLQQVPRLTANGILFDPDPNQAGSRSLLLDPVTLK